MDETPEVVKVGAVPSAAVAGTTGVARAERRAPVGAAGKGEQARVWVRGASVVSAGAGPGGGPTGRRSSGKSGCRVGGTGQAARAAPPARDRC